MTIQVRNPTAPEHATLLTPRLVLRPLSWADTDAMHAILSDAETMRYWSHPPVTSVEETKASMEKALVDDDTVRTWAVTTDGRDCLGWVTLFGVRDGIGWVGYILSPTARGKGYGEEAVAGALNHAFGAWGLHRVAANIDPRNHRSAGLLLRLGFTWEGTQRQDFVYGGTYLDTGVFGILASDWQKRRENPPAALPTLRHGPAVLRPLKAGDADALHTAFCDRESMRFTTLSHNEDIEVTRDKILATASGARGGMQWAITSDGGECLGWALLLKDTPAQISLGYLLVPAARGKGLAKAATAAMLHFAFTVLKKNRVEAEIDPRNQVSARVLEVNGFTREGIRRQGNLRPDGETVDNCLYGILASEWTAANGGETS
ncbi:GNAT family N-acetyltransferase [Niveispirillum sp. KHB5.9]|uniref:GNAT family N-acetyltransferase n=1 Tax=Niveispirillum sp. KHB5.9 TaxID=3400269 RepID=UPI003A8500A2